jgi:hypothetical protein
VSFCPIVVAKWSHYAAASAGADVRRSPSWLTRSSGAASWTPWPAVPVNADRQPHVQVTGPHILTVGVEDHSGLRSRSAGMHGIGEGLGCSRGEVVLSDVTAQCHGGDEQGLVVGAWWAAATRSRSPRNAALM